MSEFIYSKHLSDHSKSALLPYLGKFKRDETKFSYLTAFNEFADYMGKDILAMTYEDCRSYISFLENRRNMKAIRTSTILKKKKQLSSFFSYLSKHLKEYDLKESFYNYFSDIYMEEVGTMYRYERVPEVSHLNDLFVYLKENDIMTCIAFLLAFKGFLTMDEIRFLSVLDFYEDDNAKVIVKVKPPSDSPREERYNALPEDVGSLVDHYCEILANKFPKVSNPYLFSRDGRTVVTQKTLRNRLDKALKKLSLPHYTFNDLRNAGVVYAVAYHADVTLISNSLGMKTNRHIQKIDNLVIKVNDAADYIGIQFKK